jgi:hypothetical protein
MPGLRRTRRHLTTIQKQAQDRAAIRSDARGARRFVIFLVVLISFETAVLLTIAIFIVMTVSGR